MNRAFTALALTSVLLIAACGDDTGDTGDTDDTGGIAAPAIVSDSIATTTAAPEPDTIRLVAYDSFPSGDPDNPIRLALDEFTADTGIGVEVVVAGDTGTMLSKAVLTAGNPEGDVLWGVDNSFLSRAIEAGVFEPYEAAGLDGLPAELRALVPGGDATPVDFGDVCVNYDIAALDAAGVAPPAALADLARPEYESMLVVENPATSSPGLAFLLATIAEFGDDGWEDYWASLRDNDVAVVDSWTQAYYEQFSWAGGDRPMVVSYGSSPPFEVLFAAEPMTAAPTGVVEATCFRQVEFAGVLRGTEAPNSARRLVDFLISERFQREIALNLFVFPVNPDVELEQEFVDHATIPDTPLAVDPARIDEHRTDWIDRWTDIAAG